MLSTKFEGLQVLLVVVMVVVVVVQPLGLWVLLVVLSPSYSSHLGLLSGT